jgi:arginine/lysine/ornithine decarboxylase
MSSIDRLEEIKNEIKKEYNLLIPNVFFGKNDYKSYIDISQLIRNDFSFEKSGSINDELTKIFKLNNKDVLKAKTEELKKKLNIKGYGTEKLD